MTTYIGPTPWDSRIEGLEDAQIYGRPNEPDLRIFRARAEGYRLAKAEDAPLLEALTKIATAPEGAYSRDKEQYLKNVIAWCQETAWAAIAQATGKE